MTAAELIDLLKRHPNACERIGVERDRGNHMKCPKCGDVPDICKCSQLADEPDEQCEIHGWPYPKRCGRCGRFLAYDNISETDDEKEKAPCPTPNRTSNP